MMPRLLAITVFLTRLASIPLNAAEDGQKNDMQLDPAKVEFFETKIRPVLVEHCHKCHSPDAKHIRGGLQLHTRNSTLEGGESGPAVVPGKPDESLLLSSLKYDSFEMPPSGKLGKSIIADFEKWIRDGAVDPRKGKAKAVHQKIDLEKGREFWSFKPLKVPDFPQTFQKRRLAEKIDYLVQQKLQEADLQPVEPAPKSVQMRRWYYDLIGLPPTPEEINKYLSDDTPDAAEKLIDELLSSKRFGERWGRHWLDVARYADSTGGGRSRIYGNSWRYRDYVIKSYNDDKPYDQFVKEQIAGDLLESTTLEQARDQMTGLGFLMLGPINYELQDKYLLRMEIVDEQISTLGKAMLGMTIGCARCHDHKFDPIPQADYYAMAGIFRSTLSMTPGNVSNWVKRELPIPPEQKQKHEAYDKEVERVQKQIASLKKKQKPAKPARTKIKLDSLAGIVVDNTDATRTGDWMESTSIAGYVGENYIHDMGDEKGAKKVAYSVALPESGKYEFRISYTSGTNRARKVPVTIQHADEKPYSFTVDQTKRPRIDGSFHSFGIVDLKNTRKDGKPQPVIVEISNRGTSQVVIADAVQFIPAVNLEKNEQLASTSFQSDSKVQKTASKTDVKKADAEQQREEKIQRQLKELEAELAELKKNAPLTIPVVMGVDEEVPEEIGDTNLCIRGNVRNLGPIIPRGVLSVTTPNGKNVIATEGSGRLELAEWLASPQNPLTARVYVNRIWHHLFGLGIVRTTDNFGSMGELPSYPELLDYLAIEFIRNNWSTKKLIREIVLSETYRRSSHRTESQKSTDPENRLLASFPRRRADAEYLYDAIHTVSGQLTLNTQGSTIKAGIGSEYTYQFTGRHRAIFVPVFRNNIHELLQAFDFPDPNLVQGKRTATTLATQALFLMNNPLVIEQSKNAARRLLEIPQLSHEERIEFLYLASLGRKPSEKEFAVADQYLIEALGAETSELDEISAWATLCQALMGSIDFRYID